MLKLKKIQTQNGLNLKRFDLEVIQMYIERIQSEA